MYTIPIFLATLLLTKSLIDCRLIPGTHNQSSNASLTDSILPDGIPSFPGEASQDFNHSPVGILLLGEGQMIRNHILELLINPFLFLSIGLVIRTRFSTLLSKLTFVLSMGPVIQTHQTHNLIFLLNPTFLLSS